MRTLVTTENCLREIFNSPNSIWYQLVNKQKHIVVSTNSKDNSLDVSGFTQRLHNKQIKIIPQSNIVNQLPGNTDYLDFLSDCLFLLEIPKKTAEDVCRDFGVCCFSNECKDSPYITNEGWDIETTDPDKENSWDFFYKGVNRNCTSAVLIDRFLFSIEWNKGNGCLDDTIEDCKYNLKCIMDNVIPFEIKNDKFVLTIVFNHNGAIKEEKKDSRGKVVKDSKGRTVYEYYTFDEIVNMIQEIKEQIYRPFKYDVEVLSVNKSCAYYNDTHDRYVITNFHLTIATQKLVAFTPSKENLHKQNLFFKYIYSTGLKENSRSSMPIVTKEKVQDAICNLIKGSKNTDIAYALNGVVTPFNPKSIRNKLLKI